MDIAGFSMVSSQINLASQVSLAVTKMAMTTATENSEQLAKLMQASVQPGKGASIDIKL
jgi:hypothetical protein